MSQRIVQISGKVALQRPYSEARRKELLAIAEEVEAWMNDPKTDFSDMEKSAEFWRRKSEILLDWGIEGTPDLEFFKSDDFESGMLQWLEQDFIKQRLYR